MNDPEPANTPADDPEPHSPRPNGPDHDRAGGGGVVDSGAGSPGGTGGSREQDQ